MRQIIDGLEYPQNLCNDAENNRQHTLKAVLQYFYRDNTRSGSHCKYNIKYHIVWIPKYRREVLTEDISKRLKQILDDIASQYKFTIIASEVMPDHIHLLIEAPPKYSPSNLVRIIKSISSRNLREEFKGHIKEYIWKENTLWAKGYYLATLSDNVTTDVVKEYINNQKSMDKNSRAVIGR
jgi:putative transposase